MAKIAEWELKLTPKNVLLLIIGITMATATILSASAIITQKDSADYWWTNTTWGVYTRDASSTTSVNAGNESFFHEFSTPTTIEVERLCVFVKIKTGSPSALRIGVVGDDGSGDANYSNSVGDTSNYYSYYDATANTWEWVCGNFTNPYNLTAGTDYFIVITVNESNPTLNATDYYEFYSYDMINPYTNYLPDGSTDDSSISGLCEDIYNASKSCGSARKNGVYVFQKTDKSAWGQPYYTTFRYDSDYPTINGTWIYSQIITVGASPIQPRNITIDFAAESTPDDNITVEIRNTTNTIIDSCKLGNGTTWGDQVCNFTGGVSLSANTNYLLTFTCYGCSTGAGYVVGGGSVDKAGETPGSESWMVNATLDSSDGYMQYSDDNGSTWSDLSGGNYDDIGFEFGYNQNHLPVIDEINITPNPAEHSDKLTCNYNFTDDDGDSITLTYYDWYINGVSSGYNNKNLTSGNISLGDSVVCELVIFDSKENSTAKNTSILTITDETTPIISGTGAAPTSIFSDENFLASLVCTDADTSITAAKVIITKPDMSSLNFTLTHAGGGVYARTYTDVTSVGTYVAGPFYCVDSQSNVAQNSTTYNITSTARPTGGAGGGGGGGGEAFCNVNFSITTIELNSFNPVKQIIINNNEVIPYTHAYETSNNIADLIVVSKPTNQIDGLETGEINIGLTSLGFGVEEDVNGTITANINNCPSTTFTVSITSGESIVEQIFNPSSMWNSFKSFAKSTKTTINLFGSNINVTGIYIMMLAGIISLIIVLLAKKISVGRKIFIGAFSMVISTIVINGVFTLA